MKRKSVITSVACWLLTSAVLALPTRSSAGEDTSKASADADWAELEQINPYTSRSGAFLAAERQRIGDDPVAQCRWWEELCRKVRQKGTEFWENYPRDPRRYFWLQGTYNVPPSYWKDLDEGARHCAQGTPELAEIDEELLADWDRKYMIMRAEFMSAAEIPDANSPGSDVSRTRLLGQEMFHGRIYPASLRVKRGETVDLIDLARELMDQANHPTTPLSGRPLQESANMLLGMMERDLQLQQAAMHAMRASKSTELRWIAAGRQQVAQLRRQPLELRAATLGDKRVDLSGLRGKVVLVDIWSNYCVSCIEAMPKIRAVYDKYRAAGFEVVGVWLGGDAETARKDRPRALRILEEQGVNWPNAALVGEECERFKSDYSIIGVPVTWLLDEKGLLVTTEVSGGHLESEVRRLLGIQAPAEGS